MSINSAMTAIAGRIRALLGIGGSMGLDAMAANLTTVQGDIKSAYDAVRDRGGNVPASQTSGNLASAISTIPPGVTIQRKTGTFTTGKGEATINCGFQPDLVVIHKNEAIDGYFQTCALAFAEDTRSNTLNTVLWSSLSAVNIYDIWVTRLANGFAVEMSAYDEKWSVSDPATTFTYIAVKYT